MPDVEKDDARLSVADARHWRSSNDCEQQMFGHLLAIVWDDHGQWRSVSMPAGRLANRFGRSKNVTIAAKKVTAGFAQPGQLVVPLLQVFGGKLILAPNEIPDETCQTLAVGGIIPLEIEDWEYGRAIEPEPCTDQTIGQ